MSVTNWVNELPFTVPMNDNLTTGGLSNSTAPIVKSATASGAAVTVKFTSGSTLPTGPIHIYVAAAPLGLNVFEYIAPGYPNLVWIGKHLPVSVDITQRTNELDITQAFGGRLPDEWNIYVDNATGFTIVDLVVTSIQGHYETT